MEGLSSVILSKATNVTKKKFHGIPQMWNLAYNVYMYTCKGREMFMQL